MNNAVSSKWNHSENSQAFDGQAPAFREYTRFSLKDRAATQTIFQVLDQGQFVGLANLGITYVKEI